MNFFHHKHEILMSSNQPVQKQNGLFNFGNLSEPFYKNKAQITAKPNNLHHKTNNDKITPGMLKNCEPPSDAFLEKLAHDLGLEYMRGQHGADRYYATNGDPLYPPNDGALGDIIPVVLTPGMIVTRYGLARGFFFAGENDTFSQRSLPRTTNRNSFHKFKIKKLTPAEKATIAPWFNEIGRGTQYKISQDVFSNFDEFFEEI